MFGYVAPVLSALTEEQKKRYRRFYCGVCHSLRNRHGNTCRISLSNDMTFLAVLLSSLYEPGTASARSRCGVHPVKPHDWFKSSLIDYAADMNALLFYYKCEDQRMDDRSILGKAGENLFRKAADRVRSHWPMQAEGVAESLGRLWNEESRSSPDPDTLCNLSGAMLGSVFVPFPADSWSSLLRSVGESLGRFIYWMDAWEDYDEDLKKHRFNPLVSWHDRPDYGDFCRDTLEMLIAEASRSFELLPLEQDLDLLRNVIYSGVWQKYTLLTERRNRKEDRHGH